MSVKMLLAAAAVLAITAGLLLPLPHGARAQAPMRTASTGR